jgi:hypothetical protein
VASARGDDAAQVGDNGDDMAITAFEDHVCFEDWWMVASWCDE